MTNFNGLPDSGSNIREPRHRGAGIDVYHQPITDLIEGDTFSDADYGPMVWKGGKWVSDEETRGEVANNQELNTVNLNRLKSLMGDLYDGTEMSDYLSYFQPNEIKLELDLLEKKIPMFDKGELMKKFKEHLGYLAIPGGR